MRRIKITVVALASLLAWAQVLADWDAKLAAQAAAPRTLAAATAGSVGLAADRGEEHGH